MLAELFSAYGYDSSYGYPHAAGLRDGVRRLWSLGVAGGRLYQEVREPDLPPCSGGTQAKSCGAITALGDTDGTRIETSWKVYCTVGGCCCHHFSSGSVHWPG